MSLSSEQQYKTLHWVGDACGSLVLLDQTRLPLETVELECRSAEQVWEAIKKLAVRGAPAIGVAAAYGVVLGLQSVRQVQREPFFARLDQVCNALATSRPTAVNLFWALDRMRAKANELPNDMATPDIHDQLLEEAHSIRREDEKMCAAIGNHGADLLADGSGVLTHCNAGALATAGIGTALSVIFTAAEQGKALHVYADETRPLLQGARLTTWELQQHKIPVTLICDSMTGWIMKEGRVQAVITGADRIAANGDVANKIGTYSIALLAKLHQIPFYVAAPSSTFDLSLTCGNEIPIEERDPHEVTCGLGRQTAPPGTDVYNPAFDITPAEYIQAIVTERGLIEPVHPETVLQVISDREPS